MKSLTSQVNDAIYQFLSSLWAQYAASVLNHRQKQKVTANKVLSNRHAESEGGKNKEREEERNLKLPPSSPDIVNHYHHKPQSQ